MTESFKLRYRLIKLCLTLDWLMDQLRRRRYTYSWQQLRDVYEGTLTGDLAAEIIHISMDVLDGYELWVKNIKV